MRQIFLGFLLMLLFLPVFADFDDFLNVKKTKKQAAEAKSQRVLAEAAGRGKIEAGAADLPQILRKPADPDLGAGPGSDPALPQPSLSPVIPDLAPALAEGTQIEFDAADDGGFDQEEIIDTFLQLGLSKEEAAAAAVQLREQLNSLVLAPGQKPLLKILQLPRAGLSRYNDKANVAGTEDEAQAAPSGEYDQAVAPLAYEHNGDMVIEGDLLVEGNLVVLGNLKVHGELAVERQCRTYTSVCSAAIQCRLQCPNGILISGGCQADSSLLANSITEANDWYCSASQAGRITVTVKCCN